MVELENISYIQAIQRFVHLIRWFLAISVFMSYAHNAQAHVNNIQSLIEQIRINTSFR
jgi:hypothetical protein